MRAARRNSILESNMRCLGLLFLVPLLAPAADLRLGIIGTDSSHSAAFTAILNDPQSPDHVPGARVVAAFEGGSADIADSLAKAAKFGDQIRTRYGVEIVPDVATLCAKVDAVLILSNDGRVHLAQVRQVIAARKPMYIDKPLADTLEHAREIAALLKQAELPWFSSSSQRFGNIVATTKRPDVTGAVTWGPGPLEPHHHLELAWYAIHPIEILYALMGPGCQEVTRTSTANADVVVGRWRDGRIGTVRAIRPYGSYGAVVFTPDAVVSSDAKYKQETGYHGLLTAIVNMFQTGKPPVAPEETLEIYAFLDAAQRSKAAGGKPMPLR